MKRMLTVLAIAAAAFTFTGCHCPFCKDDNHKSSSSAKYKCDKCGHVGDSGGMCTKCSGGEMKPM